MLNDTVIFKRHCSEKLGLSLEIPRNWQKIAEHPLIDAKTEGYFYPTDSQYNPQIFIKKMVMRLREQNDQIFEIFADQLMRLSLENLASDQFEIITQMPSKIDNLPARLDVFVFQSPDVEIPVTQYQVCWQNHQLLYGLIGLVDSTQELEYLPVFTTVTASIRHES